MKDLKTLLKKIQDERFVHNISELTYDRLFALWHLNPRIERQLSEIITKAVVCLFFIRYLTHVNNAVTKEANVKDRLRSEDLSNKRLVEKMAKKLGKCERLRSVLEKDILPQLTDIIDNVSAENLTDLVKLAHAGDYLSVVLNDLEAIEDPEYLLWLEAVPEYYDKDLKHIGLKKRQSALKENKRRSLALEKWIINLNTHAPSIEAVYAKGRTFSIRPQVKERRRPLVGFNRWVKENTRVVKSV